MPSLRVLAILGSDLHLSHKAPLARQGEPDWYAAQKRVLLQITEIQKEVSGGRFCPLILAGDVFDHWDEPAELIRFAIQYLPQPCYGVPGQHDLVHHRFDSLHRTALGVLISAGRFVLVEPSLPIELDGLVLHGFPWGVPIGPLERHALSDQIHLAIVHAYCWRRGKSYPGASEDSRVPKFLHRLRGFDAAVFGDNHKGFLCDHEFIQNTGKYTLKALLNNGALMRRKSDEVGYNPQVGLLHEDGSISVRYLDTTEDVFDVTVKEEKAESKIDAGALLEELESLECSLDFRDAVLRAIDSDKLADGVKQVILKALDRRE